MTTLTRRRSPGPGRAALRLLVTPVGVVLLALAACAPAPAGSGAPNSAASGPAATEQTGPVPQPTEPVPRAPRPSGQPTEPQTAQPQPAEPEPTEPDPTEPQPTEPQPVESQPVESQPVEPQPTPVAETAASAALVPAVSSALRAGLPFSAAGTLVDPTLGRYRVDLVADGRGSGRMTMRLEGGAGELRVVDGTAYLSGDARFYAALVGDLSGAPGGPVPDGTWLRLPPGPSEALSASFRSDLLLPEALAVRGTATLGGAPVWVLEGSGGSGGVRLYLPAGGPALPDRVVADAGTDLTLGWADPGPVDAPPDAVDL